MLRDFLTLECYGNSVQSYLVFLGMLAAGILVVAALKKIVLRRVHRWAETTESRVDDLVVDIIRKMVVPLAYYGVFVLATEHLALNPSLAKAIDVAGIFLLTLLVSQFLIAAAKFGMQTYVKVREQDSSRERAIHGFMALIQVVVWGLATVFLLDNLGFEIATVIAGLGIGGIAVALAAQNILGDLFGYFIILFDRPFEVGDFIIVGDYMGVIDHLGLKTTRIASLGGEQIVMSNKDLTDSRVRNYKRMGRRRVVFHLGVTYQTPYEKLKVLPEVIADVVRGIEDTAFDRAHFQSYGDFSLVFEVVYYVVGNDYTRYMDIQQEINFRIHEEFEKRDVEFAYPTQTVFLARAAAKREE